MDTHGTHVGYVRSAKRIACVRARASLARCRPAAWIQADGRHRARADSLRACQGIHGTVPPVRLDPSGRAAPCHGCPGTVPPIRLVPGMPWHGVTSPNFGQAVDLEVAEEVEDNRLRNLLHRSPYQLRAKIKKRPTRATTNILP
ncbi:hypothetical protein ACJIZ3_023772 [Penstemon smallii]|uniref:Uncharacterized protein n=1 Tax=Penstemon smallii TaxID=265156 RepID=A0ABD3TPY5_9LAMI